MQGPEECSGLELDLLLIYTRPIAEQMMVKKVVVDFKAIMYKFVKEHYFKL